MFLTLVALAAGFGVALLITLVALAGGWGVARGARRSVTSAEVTVVTGVVPQAHGVTITRPTSTETTSTETTRTETTSTETTITQTPTTTPTTPTTIATTPDRAPVPTSAVAGILANGQYYRGMPTGNVAFNTPRAMVRGEATDVRLIVLLHGSLEHAKSAVGAAGETEGAKARIAPTMKAILSGSGFHIIPQGDETQQVTFNGPTSWEWQVVPTKTGTLRLYL